MLNTRHSSVRSVIGPARPPALTLRRLLRGLPRHATADTERVLAALQEVPIPDPWNLRDFIDGVEQQRGRPIRLEPYPTRERHHPCGLWLQYDDVDVILYDQSTSRYHCQQIILHEIGHIVLQHQPQSVTDTADFQPVSPLLPDIDVSAMTHFMARTTFDDTQEHQAELFASLLLSQHSTTTRGIDLFPF